jgi:hypothetical protein
MIDQRRRAMRLAARARALLLRRGLVAAFGLAAAMAAALVSFPADALPLYARQTGEPCATCHTAFLELTPFGRRFKLGAYTLTGGDWKGPPFAVMLQPGFTHLQEPQPGGLAPGFGVNNDFAMQQISLFTGGRITENSGAFVQGTYDGVGHRFGWDNTDIRYARSVEIGGYTLLWGIDLNNNPTVQDVWNTIPAWNFPYITSALAPQPLAMPFINQVYAQHVAGLSAYGFIDDAIYFEVGGYRALSANSLLALGVDISGQSPISGTAPYWRVAAEKNIGDHSWEVGTFGLAARVLPLSIGTAGTDSFADFGIDTQYQYLGDPHAVTVRGAWIHEDHNTGASQTLGLAQNASDQLHSVNASVSYIYDHTWSLSAGRISVGGTADPGLYATPAGSPNSAGWIGEIAYLPFSHGGPSFWPWLNFRIGLQYTRWSKFDGSTSNIDGTGRSAAANNTFFVYVWTMF